MKGGVGVNGSRYQLIEKNSMMTVSV